MEVNKLNDLGVFDTIEAIWKRYPEGGRDGDYATIGEQECYWDKFQLSWVGVGIEREKSARGSHTFGGDVVVNNDLRIGGTLYAANVRQPNCGLFPTLEALKKVHPNPTAGMWAYVGTTIPSPVHRCDVDGVWNEEGEVATSKISAEVLDEITGQIGSKLSKTTADTANEHITFAKGLTTLNAIVRELASVKQLSVTDVANITKAVINGEIKSNDYSNTDGFKIFKGANGWNIEIDHITARKTFKTLELVVQRVVHQGGMIIQSPAGGKIERVESEDANHYYVKVTNAEQFRAGDLVLCQRFTGRSTKRYWRRVVGSNATHMFISKTDCEADSGAVEVGDHIAVLGNKIDRTRQSARVICVIGENSPYVADYAGIDNYTLQGKLINQIGNLSGVSDPTFGGNLSGVGLYTKNLYAKGNIQLSSGESVESYTERKMQEAKRESEKISGAYYNKTIDATELDPNKYYPVFILLQKNGKRSHIKLSRQLDRNYNLNGEKPPYSWHTHGFSYNLEWEVAANQWGSYDMNRKIKNIGGVFTDYNKIAGDISQFTQMSVEVVYVRGGSKYDVSVLGAGSTDVRFPNDIIELHPRGYTYDSHIKGNRSFTGGNEEQARRWYGTISFPIKDSVVAPQVTDVEEAVERVRTSDLYVTKSSYSSDIQVTNNLISQKVSRADFNALGERVASAESSITQKANEIRIEVTSAIDGAKTEARQNINTAISQARTELTESITAESLRQVKAGIKVETGKLTLFGREVSVLGSAHFHALDGKINSKMTTSTYIEGGKIKTSLLNVDEIVAQIVDVQKMVKAPLLFNPAIDMDSLPISDKDNQIYIDPLRDGGTFIVNLTAIGPDGEPRQKAYLPDADKWRGLVIRLFFPRMITRSSLPKEIHVVDNGGILCPYLKDEEGRRGKFERFISESNMYVELTSLPINLIPPYVYGWVVTSGTPGLRESLI